MKHAIYKTADIKEDGNYTKVKLPEGVENSSLKGKVVVINPESSEIAKNLDINEKGVYGLKLK
jgi:hypothetical protein